jgi:two-component system alkaline phosphatase synthesis response regulator PhoP
MKQQKHILVVEDERHLAVGIKYNLEAEGYEVHVVADGATALKYVEQADPDVDLVILDLMLPGMSGYTVCDSLRDAGFTMPVLILSARTLPEDRTRGFDVGADQYLTKPFELDELLSRTKNLLARYRSSPTMANGPRATNEFEFGTAHVNFDTYQVTVDDKPVRMTPLELRLLEYFVRNEGRVVPRAELLERVWEMPAHIKTRAPDQFIRRLRKTFEPRPERPRHFLTIRDAGYRFVADGEDPE